MNTRIGMAWALSNRASIGLAAQARVVTVRWDPVRRKPVPFSEAERTQLTAAMTL